MKKRSVLILMLLFVASSASAEATKVGPDAARHARREELKAIKAQMKAKKAAHPQAPGQSKWEQFWAKEGERSGLSQSGNGVGQFMRNLNPAPFFKNQQERYNERKGKA